jgi:hypothetical protein
MRLAVIGGRPPVLSGHNLSVAREMSAGRADSG